MRRRFFIKDIIGEILYTSNNGSIIRPYNAEAFGSKIRSNNYTDHGVITFFGSINKIGESAFYNSYTLSSIMLPNSVVEIGDSAFYYCTSLTSVNIPDSVTTIGDSAFENCESLTSVTIPDSVTTIGNSAFWCCYSLTSVYCKATTPPTLYGSSVFYGNGSGRKIYVPYQSLDAYKTATIWSKYADDIVGYDFENDTVVGGGLITFTVDGIEYQAEEGMTWEDWVNSEYSNDLFFIMGSLIGFKETGGSIANTDGTVELLTNSIINGYRYVLMM